MVEGGNIELGAVVMYRGVRLLKQLVYLSDHLLPSGLVYGAEKDLFLSVPLRGPAQGVALLNYVVWVYVLIPQTPGVNLVRGCFNIE